MNDRAPIRDRTLILRVLVPGLETRLRDKMKEMHEAAASTTTADKSGTSNSNTTSTSTSNNKNTSSNSNSGGTNSNSTKDICLDLEGVTCEPTAARDRTLWNFHCDGASYPARLVNLPCPVELHKTHDHAAYYKSADIAQMLIVYEDDMALEEAEEKAVEGFPSYYHSGLTPAMKRVVERRFTAREHSAAPPPRAAVADIEAELLELMEKIAKDEKSKRNRVPLLSTANKILEEVQEEIVDYEPWMDDYGRQPNGITFDADDALTSLHPDVWLNPEVIREIKEQDEEAKRKKQAAATKKEAKRKEKKALQESTAAAAAAAQTHTKRGIVSKKNTEIVDDVTQAAASMMVMDSIDLVSAALEDDDFFGDLDLEDEGLNFEDM
jgi:transcription initiation factor TFIID subunit 7